MMKGKEWLVFPVCLVLVLLFSSIGVTRGSFVDQESTGGNTFQAWAATSWVQTTQVDFESGTLNQVETSSSPGDVKLAVKGDWYDTSWSHRAPIIINNPSSVLTDFQIKVQVTYDSDMQPNFDDIRFTASNGTTLLSYWRQGYTTSVSALFWVKVPSISSGSSTVYMYYGNAAVSSASDGMATFDFFDDFSADLSKWTIDPENTDKVYIDSGNGNTAPALRQDPDSTQTRNDYFDTRFETSIFTLSNGVIEYDLYLAGDPRIIHQLGFRVDSLNFTDGYCWRMQTSDGDGGWLYFSDGGWDLIDTEWGPTTSGVWHSVKLEVSDTNFNAYVDDDSVISVTDDRKQTADHLISHVHGVDLDESSYVLIDNVRVRQYTSQEPTISPGSEEGQYILSGTIASHVLDTSVSGAVWNVLSWEVTLPGNTGITFEVRASDTLFLKDAATPAWTSVGGNSPVTSGFPSGRYMQWQATLVTSDTTNTPTLHEVKIYHY